MKKFIFTIGFLTFSIFNYAASYRNYVSHSVTGSVYTIFVDSNTAFGENVIGQICDNGAAPFTGFITGSAVGSTTNGTLWKLIVTLNGQVTPKLELANNNAGGTYGYTGCNITMSNVLANELTSFSAAKQNNQVNLSWLTASEKSNDNFSIERSKDGRNFAAIGQIKGGLNSTVSKEYAFTDVSPLKGTNYYRLKSTEVSGKATYSNVVSVSLLDKSNKTFVYPNPVAQTALRLEHEAIADGDLSIRIMDITGRIVQSEKRAVVNGSNLISLDVNNLSSGQYIIVIDEQLVRFIKN
jgi:Secretion system C-terminal sorting domain